MGFHKGGIFGSVVFEAIGAPRKLISGYVDINKWDSRLGRTIPDVSNSIGLFSVIRGMLRIEQYQGWYRNR